MIVVIANNDLDLLALRAAVESLPDGFPPVRAHGGVGLGPDTQIPDLDGARAVLVRLLKGKAAWEHQLDDLRAQCLATGTALLAFGGEASIDAEMTALSTVPAGIVTEAFAYLARGGPANLANLLRFVADTVLLEGFGFEPPQDLPMSGLVRPNTETAGRAELPGRPTVAVVTYRANVLAGNTLPVEQLCDAIERRGANARGVYCYSLRNDPAALDLLRGADVVVTTTWAAGGTVHEGDAVTATTDGEGWASPLDALDVPVLQAVASTGDTATWTNSTTGLSPLDVALGVAIPEFDGRIIGPPLSFKEVVDDGDQLGVALAAHRAVPDRVERIAGLATRLARLRHLNNADKRVALVLTAYPTKRSRIGNAVALDTPLSLLRLLDALAQAGYKVDEVPEDSDAFMARLADGLTYDQPRLSPAQQAMAVGRLPVDDYVEWFATLPTTLRQQIEADWAPRPATSPSTTTTSCSPASASDTSSSRSSRHEDSARTPSAPTTPPTSRRPTTTWPSTGGSALPIRAGASAPTPSSTWASTAPSSGSRARAPARRRPASPTPPSATCRCSTPSSSTTRARAPRPSAAPTRWSSTTCRRP